MLVELSRVEQRYQAVLEVRAGASVTSVAARFGVTRQSMHSPIIEVLGIVAIAAVSTLIAALWPARKAAGIRPAVALRITD